MSTDLGFSGQAIWEAYGAEQLDASSRALVREFARCADVLDRLNDIAIGNRDVWVSLVFDDMGEVHIAVDRILDEQRKSMVTFKTLHGELRQAGIKPGTSQGSNSKDEEPEDMLAALRKKKEDRESQSG